MIRRLRIILFLLSFGITCNVFCQNQCDSILLITNLDKITSTAYHEPFSNHYQNWRYVFYNCELRKKYILFQGLNIYENLISIEEDSIVKYQYYDSVNYIFDQFIEIYGDEARSLLHKSSFLLRTSHYDYSLALSLLKKSEEISLVYDLPNPYASYFDNYLVLYNKKLIGIDKLKTVYDISSLNLNRLINESKYDKVKKEAKIKLKEINSKWLIINNE